MLCQQATEIFSNTENLLKLLEDGTFVIYLIIYVFVHPSLRKCVGNLVELERIKEGNKVLVRDRDVERSVGEKKPEIQKKVMRVEACISKPGGVISKQSHEKEKCKIGDQTDGFATVSVQSFHEENMKLIQLVSETKNAKNTEILLKLWKTGRILSLRDLFDCSKCVENLVELEKIREANKALGKEDDRDAKDKKPEIQKRDAKRKRPAEKKQELQKKDGKEEASSSRPALQPSGDEIVRATEKAQKKILPCPRCDSRNTIFDKFSRNNISKPTPSVDGTSSFALSGDEAMAGAGKGPFVSSMREKPNFLMISLAISSFALNDGWYSSQNTYLLLSLHSTGAGKHVKAGRILPNDELCESALLNPAMTNHLSLSELSEGYPSICDKA
ncbi:cyclic dof factor 2-like [Pyrus ussuriensis x Pyrus communis]|uniref:Cyclic dof factor 2-like n=1 Tax=Pyrus ussuriensis x Pyrus communis TaxID=2448454 RepID=A0A5N5I553_9ROSA|nr:cyclic dof factor 2-like [Pyrus ussuriensis x Pyrus communis]